MKFLSSLALVLALASVPAIAADNNFPTPGGATVPGAVNMQLNGAGQAIPASAANPLPVSIQYSTGSTAVTSSAVGTTAATSATLPAVAGKTTFLCGFSIRANATAAATGNATVVGAISGTLNFTQWAAPFASGLGVTEPTLGSECIPGSGANTAIVVTSAAPGAGGTVSVSAWGYQQ